MFVDLNDFKREAKCTYKNEHYSVRDNGSVFRHARPDKPLRKFDNQWTFGTPNNHNYMLIALEVVHRIVAYAFLGEPPTAQHIVDHKDTNRQNNRPENLRWLTKLENILNNPVTLKKIIFYCGSIEAFLENPSILKSYVDKEPNFGWMRAVSPKEAQISWERMSNWAANDNNKTSSKGGSLGEWIFQDDQDVSSLQDISELTKSLTPNAVQKDWKTPCEFPYCPRENTNSPIADYTSNLKYGEAFSQNQYSKSIIVDFALTKEGNSLLIMCKSIDDTALKPWTLAQVTYENELYVHTNLGGYFRREGAEKLFILSQGLEWTGEDSFEDFI